MIKHFSIPKPCGEKWSEMIPTQKGAFCASCSHEVHDVTKKSSPEIAALFEENKGKRTCVRMTVSQESQLNYWYRESHSSRKKHMQRAMLLSLLIVFGFTLFSCNNPQQVQEVAALQHAVRTLEHDTILNTEDATSGYEISDRDGLSISNSTKSEHVKEKSCGVDEDQLLLLGEPVFREEVEEEIVAITQPDERYITMGIPIWREDHELELPEAKQIEETENSEVSDHFVKAIVFPNPAKEATTLKLTLKQSHQNASIRLFDISGKEISKVYNGDLQEGVTEIYLPLTGINSGMYIVDIRSLELHKTVRLQKR
jgi:hypothetical protein